MGFPGGAVVMNPHDNAGDGRDPWVGKMPWRRTWQPTPVFLPGESEKLIWILISGVSQEQECSLHREVLLSGGRLRKRGECLWPQFTYL